MVGLAGFGPAECGSQSPVPYRLATAQCNRNTEIWDRAKTLNLQPDPKSSLGWIVRFELTTSRATTWRANQLRHTHHITCLFLVPAPVLSGIGAGTKREWRARRDSNPRPTA